MSRFATEWCLLLGLAVACRADATPPSTLAEASSNLEGTENDKAIAEIKRLVSAGDWNSAYEHVKNQGSKRTLLLLPDGECLGEPDLHSAANSDDSSPHQKRSRALAARKLGLKEVAFQQHVLQIELEKNANSRNNARMDAARCAFQIARDATAAGDLDRAAQFFDKMALHGDTWFKEAGAAKAILVRQLATTPRDVPFRIEFADKFWIDNVPALGKNYAEARKLLIETLPLSTSQGERQQLCQLLIQYSQQLGDTDSVDLYTEKLVAETGVSEPIEGALSRARYYLAQKEFQKAKDLLQGLLDEHKNSPVASMPMLLLAEVHAANGESDKEQEWLLRCATFPKTVETVRHIMDADSTQAEAIQRLAINCEAKKDWKQALDWWKKWTPSSFCGTCRSSMRAERTWHLALCHAKLGEACEATELLLRGLLTGNYQSHFAPALFRLYEAAGQLDDLKSIADTHANHSLQQLFEIAECGRGGNGTAESRQWRDQFPATELDDPSVVSQVQPGSLLKSIEIEGEEQETVQNKASTYGLSWIMIPATVSLLAVAVLSTRSLWRAFRRSKNAP